MIKLATWYLIPVQTVQVTENHQLKRELQKKLQAYTPQVHQLVTNSEGIMDIYYK